MRSRSLLLVLVGSLLGVVVVVTGLLVFPRRYEYQGSVIEPSISIDDFTLSDQNGEIFHLSDHKGSVVVLFFGYTYCPDVCPATLFNLSQVLDQLGKDAEEVEVLFITVDPDRDSPDRLKDHLSNFSDSFTGLTGSEEELLPVWDAFFVYHEYQKEGKEENYLVDHTARTYALDKNGDFKLTFPFGMENQVVVEDLRQLLREN